VPSASPAPSLASSRRRELVMIPFTAGPTALIRSRMTCTWLSYGPPGELPSPVADQESEPGGPLPQIALDPLVAPARVLPRHLLGQRRELGVDRRLLRCG
jgi:hypothetical protein